MTKLLTVDYLEVTGNSATVNLSNPAYCLTNIAPLLGSAAARGSDRKIPGTAGVRAYPRRRTVTEFSLDLVVDGSVDVDGAATGTRQKVYDHLDYLNTQLVVLPAAANGTRLATLREPDTTTRTAYIHVVSIDVEEALSPYVLRCSFNISIPAGRFTP